ncbi:GTP-binding protein Rit2 isoform X3 [Mustela lutreola]|uniref:GTP-binding protein Rit2 isoform X3 n=1 Tax=Mustela lutreola TaxID=9666 RepID=UPI002796F79B|nr:GTP-binding protein Rit2 isoform X3 [Mustela lutreola]
MTPLLTCHTPPPFGVSTTPTYFKLTNFPSRFLPWNTYAYILTMNSVYLTTLHLCLEDAYKTQVRIDDEPAYLDILDTAGQAEFTAMREQYMRGGEGFIICYSITDRQSFQEAAKFKELIFQVRHTYEIPLVLVGNKIDLEQFRQEEVALDEVKEVAPVFSSRILMDSCLKLRSLIHFESIFVCGVRK